MSNSIQTTSGFLWSFLPALQMQPAHAMAVRPAPAPFPPQPQFRCKHTGQAVCKDNFPSHRTPLPSPELEHTPHPCREELCPSSCPLTETWGLLHSSFPAPWLHPSSVQATLVGQACSFLPMAVPRHPLPIAAG